MLETGSTLASPRPTLSERRLREFLRERIVAASVEEDEARAGAAQHLLQHEVEFDRLEVEIGFGSQLGVDRSEVVLLVDLQAMAGIVEQAHIGTVQRFGEGSNPLFHVALLKIDPLNHVEAEPAQLGGNSAVTPKLGQRAVAWKGGQIVMAGA